MKPGERVADRYVIEAVLGQGGMGEVHRAYDEILHRRVALKLLFGDVAESQGGASKRRILREARAAAALTHPNVVAIHDVGEHDGTPFIVMELVTGRSLRLLQGGKASPAERMRWLVDVARALAAAHRVGLVHRDVKPENVIVSEDGIVKVLDFGIARRAEGARADAPAFAPSNDAVTHGSSFAGTPAYIAPEVLRREPVDARADQFSWGVMAYEILARRTPWDRSTPSALLHAILHEEAEPLDPAALGVPPEVTTAIARAMRKAPGDRFPSMEALVGALGVSPLGDSGRDLRAVDIASAPTLPMETTASPTLRVRPARRARAIAFATLGAIALASIAIWAAERRAPRPAVAAPAASSRAGEGEPLLHARDPRRLTFEAACEEFPSIARDGRTIVFDGTYGDDAHVVALDVATGAQRLVTTARGWQFAAQLSPDGSSVAYIDALGDRIGAYVAPIDGSSPPRLLRLGQVRPTWSPRGDAVWAGSADVAERVDVRTLATTRTLVAPKGTRIPILLELDDGRVFSTRWDRVTRHATGVIRFDPGRDEPIEVFGAEVDEAIALTNDGTRLLVAKMQPTQKSELWAIPIDADAGAPSFTGDGVVQATKGIAVRGDRVVWSTCGTDAALAVLDDPPASTGRSRDARAQPLFPPAEWQDADPAGVPGTTKLVLVSNRSGVDQLWLLDATSREPARAIPTEGLVPSQPAVSPDGAWVAFAAKQKGLFVVPLDGSRPPRQVTREPGDGEPSFGRDARTLYFTTEAPRGDHRAIASVAIDGDAPPAILVEDASRPSASPIADRVAFLTGTGKEMGEVRVIDLATRAIAPLTRGLRPGMHSLLHYSPDGRRVVLGNGLTEVVDLDVASGEVRRRFASGDSIDGATWVGDRVVIARSIWRGDLWSATIGR